ncbi:MAG: S8 family serine peptidase [Pseudomonadota bacterium]|nr:S8 family serine peptidase [Pseudomonadota bacterium]
MAGQKIVPDFIVEYFLLGRTRADAVDQFLQDGGIVIDVWLEFAKDLEKAVRVLVAPVGGEAAIDLGYHLHKQLSEYRRHPATAAAGRASTNVSPLENYVAATIYFDELIHVMLPMTRFFEQKQLAAINWKLVEYDFPLEMHLDHEIRRRLGGSGSESPMPSRKSLRHGHWRVIEAAPVAALLGVFSLARQGLLDLPSDPATIDPRQPQNVRAFNDWVRDHAEQIAMAATAQLKHRAELFPVDDPSRAAGAQAGMISRIFLDRKATPAHSEAICTVKADAAKLLFEITCTNITWAIIDSGIAATHPAFFDHSTPPGEARRSRVRATYDFTLIDQIRNFDLIDHEPDTFAFHEAVRHIIDQLVRLQPGREDDGFRARAETLLGHIADQLRLRLRPDWSLIEPLISLMPDDGAQLPSDHGTHVAGILGADWRSEPDSESSGPRASKLGLKGICPDIKLYDLRVLPSTNRGDELRATESAIVAALEFVQYLNRRSMADTPVIHGVNISMSIPHDVRNYGCGATPICIACDRLVGAGVVVVAAAGNRGWHEQEIGFGNFVFCSITDPGNARDVITVGSTHRLKPHIYGVSYFSSRGPTGDGRTKPDLVAPGEHIRGPIRGDLDRELSGTSMAAPFVSGAAAMLLARRPELIGRALAVKEVLCSSATDLQRERYFQGHGLLDVLRALQFE